MTVPPVVNYWFGIVLLAVISLSVLAGGTLLLLTGLFWVPNLQIALMACSVVLVPCQIWFPRLWRFGSTVVLAAVVPTIDASAHWLSLGGKPVFGEPSLDDRLLVDLALWLVTWLVYLGAAIIFPGRTLRSALRDPRAYPTTAPTSRP